MEHLLTNLSLEKIGLLVIGIVVIAMAGFMVYYICYAIIRITEAICSACKNLGASQGRERGDAAPTVCHIGITMPDGGTPVRKEGEEESCVKHHLKEGMCTCCNCRMRELTDSSCVKVGGHCQAIDMDNHPYTLCLGSAPASCPNSTLIADAHYCKCPIGHVLVKNFYKDVDNCLPKTPADRTSMTVPTRH